ncbi:class A beta-lactamase-related serine hydrolase [Amycolatopsis thermoflava]|uniref:Beta-lactamase class A n=1 Tax=Amycolatopsis thermoflava TaxID=84480 RepID=A0A3N2H3Y2_9PSEU|nr:class A beta-lactamase-related serine hydrolase [Amycolatopsis thermoflava]ROS43159.1 beta-lactamase class A [Amycolatopsis thermoflava]
MRSRTAGKVVLPAAVFGAVTMLIFTVQHQPRASSASEVVQVSAPVASTTTPEPSPPPATESDPAPAADTPPAPAEDDTVAQRVQDLARTKVASAEVGVEVYDRQTGVVLTQLNADQQFYSMSVVKLLIALDVLRENGWGLPASSTQTQLTRMITASDDGIASSLWVAHGGTAIVTRMARLIGLTGTEPPSSAGQWGSTKITAADMVKVYNYIEDELPQASRDLLYNAMYHASEHGSDGTDQYFGIPDGLPGTTWAIKQGWGTSGSQAVYNTTGLLGADARYVVIVLIAAPSRYYRTLPMALTTGTTALQPLVS